MQGRNGSTQQGKPDTAGVDLFSPLIAFPVAYLAWFGIASVNFLDADSPLAFGAFAPMPAYLWGYYVLGLIGYFGGIALVSRRGAGHRPTGQPIENVWSEKAFRRAVIALFAMGAGAYLYIVAHIGVPILQPDAYVVRLQIGKHGPMQAVMLSSVYTLLIIIPAWLWTRGKEVGGRIVYAGVAGTGAVLMLSLGGRGYLIAPLLTAVILRNYLKTRYRATTTVLVCLALFAGTSYYGYRRDTAFLGVNEIATLSDAGYSRYLIPYSYAYLYVRYSVATFRDVTETIPSQVPYQHGWLTFQPFQVLLPGHHNASDYFFKEILDSDFEGAGRPATLLGTFYGDFGPAGIFVFMMLWGALSMAAYRNLRRNATVLSAMVYAWLVHASLLGLFHTVFPFPTHLWLPVMWLMMDWFLRQGGRVPRLAPA